MIRSKDTRPELIVRKYLWRKGYRYRLHRKDLPGKPDIVLPKYKLAIFVNGCFWHMHNCKKFVLPSTNTKFWYNKLSGNKKRDKENFTRLKKTGWNYFLIWECQLAKKKGRILNKLIDTILSISHKT
jgi:DNA mismatch endonuclease (patch repair protein)